MPVHVVRRFGALMPSLSPRMSIAQAMDIVFGEQETLVNRDVDGDYFHGAVRSHQGGDAAAAARIESSWSEEPLDAASARRLTEQIRTAPRQVCLLLLEAHERRAWVILGYVRWEDYVATEFGFSRSRSYELLDQGRVILALQQAAGIAEIPDISGYAAGQIKRDLPEIKERIRAQTAGVSGEAAMQQALDVVELYRTQTKARVGADRVVAASSGGTVVAAPGVSEVVAAPAAGGTLHHGLDPGCSLHEVMVWLADLPPAPVVVSRIPDLSAYDTVDVRQIVRWLGEFATELDRRRPPCSEAARRAG